LNILGASLSYGKLSCSNGIRKDQGRIENIDKSKIANPPKS